jgi:hypothetical protein
MPEISEDEACVLDYLLEVQEEPFTSTQRSPEMIRHRFLIAGINVSVQHVVSVQWSLYKKGLLDKRTTPEGIRFKISAKGIRAHALFCKRNNITS